MRSRINSAPSESQNKTRGLYVATSSLAANGTGSLCTCECSPQRATYPNRNSMLSLSSTVIETGKKWPPACSCTM